MSQFAQKQHRGQENTLAAIAQLSCEGASQIQAETHRPRRSPTTGKLFFEYYKEINAQDPSLAVVSATALSAIFVQLPVASVQFVWLGYRITPHPLD